MSGVNKVILIGRLGADPKIDATRSGAKVASLSIATSKTWKDKTTGERKETTEWHRVAIYNEPLVAIAQQYLKKGHQTYLEGELRTRKYTDSSGVERYTTEVVLPTFGGSLTLLENRREAADESGYGSTKPRPSSSDSADRRPVVDDFNDEIPF